MDKIIAFFMALFMFFPSYLLSFLPFNYDEEFEIMTEQGAVLVDGKAADYELTAVNGGFRYTFSDLDADIFNYFGIIYSSDAYMKGIITYSGKNQGVTEEFFLEPGTDASFYSLIDGYLDNAKITESGVVPLCKPCFYAGDPGACPAVSTLPRRTSYF